MSTIPLPAHYLCSLHLLISKLKLEGVEDRVECLRLSEFCPQHFDPHPAPNVSFFSQMFLISVAYPALGLPLWLSWQRIRLQCGRPGFDPRVGKIPWRRERPPTPVFCPGEFHSLYSPRGRKEKDMTQRVSLSQSPALARHWTYPESSYRFRKNCIEDVCLVT